MSKMTTIKKVVRITGNNREGREVTKTYFILFLFFQYNFILMPLLFPTFPPVHPPAKTLASPMGGR